jgi:predicted NBD/HSP70 family sugar kinase
MSPTSAPELMRQPTRTAILEMIQDRGPISRVDLARLLSLNPATVTRITRLLLEEDLICETGDGTSSSAGRKPILLSFNHRARLLAALYAGSAGVSGVIADTSGTVLTRRTLLPEPGLPLHSLSALLNDLLAADPSYQRRLATLCLCAGPPTPVPPALADSLHDALHIPVLAGDEIELAALGEATWGAARERAHFALLWLGPTSGACIYLNGMMRSGNLGFDSTGQPLTARLSDAGLVSAASALLDTDPASALHELTRYRRLSARMIFEAAQQHDLLAEQVIGAAARDLAQMIAWLGDVLSLDLIVLGGAWTPAAPLLIAAMETRPDSGPRVIAAELGDDAPLFGAIQRALAESG